MTPEEIAAASKCYSCMDDTQKQAAVVYLLEQLRQQEASDGTVTSFLFTDANGIAGVVTNPTTTPNLTLSLGAITPISAAFTGVGGAGFISLLTQAANPSAPASGFAVYADSTGRFSWRRASDGFTRTWDATLTANRVYTLKDATGTIPLLEVANTWSANGALSAPAASFTGTPITGGTATTTKPLVLVETAGATSSGWSTSGTMLGVNGPSGFAGRILDVGVNGTIYFTVSSTSSVTTVGNYQAGTSITSPDVILSRKGAANWQLGAADAASPVAQTLSVQSVVAGTADTAGAAFNINCSRGTGTGAGGSFVVNLAPAGGAGSTQNTLVAGLTISGSSLLATFGGTISVAQAAAIGWGGRTLMRSASDGVISLRNNAENGFTSLNLGPDTATPSNVSLITGGGSGTDKNGGNLTVQPGVGTGTGRAGDLIVKTGLTTTTGSAAQTASTREYASAKFVDLTESTATTLFTLTVGTAAYTGFTCVVTTFATDGTDHQAITSTLTVSAVNKAGTITATIAEAAGTTAASAGTLTHAFTVVDNGSGVLAFKDNAVSSLSQTILRAKWFITALNSNDAATVTPV